jgi:hypothetical protein
MTPTPEPEHLSHHHRTTLAQIMRHPVSHNIEWKAVLSLLEAVGSVTQTHDGKFLVAVRGQTQTIDRSRNKDLDEQQVVDLRRLLTNAGFTGEAK